MKSPEGRNREKSSELKIFWRVFLSSVIIFALVVSTVFVHYRVAIKSAQALIDVYLSYYAAS